MVTLPGTFAGSALEVQAVRGATCVAADDRRAVTEAVHELLQKLVSTNGVAPEQIVSAIFTATHDVRSMYPAEAARGIGWSDVPMLCLSEMEVQASLARCIRVLLHVRAPAGRRLVPVYLREARSLRPDLVARVGNKCDAGQVLVG